MCTESVSEERKRPGDAAGIRCEEGSELVIAALFFIDFFPFSIITIMCFSFKQIAIITANFGLVFFSLFLLAIGVYQRHDI